MKRPVKIQINYKSGQSVAFRCKSFKVSFNPFGEIAKVTWDDAMPRPMSVGVDHIESVWELK